MPTNKPHFSIVMDDELLSIVEQFQKEQGIRSRGKAISTLLRAGVAEVLEETKKAAPPEKSDETANKDSDISRILSLQLSRLGVIKPGEDLSDADSRFLNAMWDAIKAYFQK